ncbi:MAG TPA: hypothetical protein VFD92_16495 [Candidatus Binatia bacterium]|nr:hypothetical protein [Candidatus Binatia bacterium]
MFGVRCGLSLEVALAAVLLVGCSKGWVRRKETSVGASGDASFLYGDLDGFLQIPRGGQPGTTSSKRPTFDELGFGSVPMADVSVAGHLAEHELYGGARIIDSSAQATLGQTLTSHGTIYPGGSQVGSSAQLNWYRVGYRYRLGFRGDDGRIFDLTPGVELALLSFAYDLHGPDDLASSRSFSKGTVRMGVGSSLDLGLGLSVAGNLSGSLPVASMPSIFSVSSTLNYRFWSQGTCEARASLGVAYDQVGYRDRQQVPNDIDATVGPSLMVGISGTWSPSCGGGAD